MPQVKNFLFKGRFLEIVPRWKIHQEYTVNIYRYKTIEANANTDDIPTKYQEILQPISEIPLASIGWLHYLVNYP